MNKLTQKQQIFYRLLQYRKKQPSEYIPIWQFIGEFYIEEKKEWGFISYEVSARMSELWREILPEWGIIERQTVEGKSGAKYFAYRINPQIGADYIAAYPVPEQYKDVLLLVQGILPIRGYATKPILEVPTSPALNTDKNGVVKIDCNECSGTGKQKMRVAGTHLFDGTDRVIDRVCMICNGTGVWHQ